MHPIMPAQNRWDTSHPTAFAVNDYFLAKQYIKYKEDK
jgi:hypothetical protein